MILHPNFIFGHLEKTGGTFIEHFLTTTIQNTKYLGMEHMELVGYELDDSRYTVYVNSSHGVETSRHDPIYRFIPVNKKVIKFGYIRNPYDWYLSLWSFSKVGHSTYKHCFTEDGSTDDINIFVKSLFNMTYSLCYYTNTIYRNDMKPELPHIDLSIAYKLDIGLLTYRYLYIYYHPDVFNDIENYTNYLLLDKVLRFESLIEELRNFFIQSLSYKLSQKQDKFLLDCPKLRTSKHRHYSDDYYTDEIIELIKHKDRIIFKEYGYDIR